MRPAVAARCAGLALLASLLVPGAAALAAPELGERLALRAVDDCGELQLEGEEVRYLPWRPEARPLLVHFMAARPGLDELNGPLVRQLVRRRPALAPLTVTLIDARDAVWGTGGLVKGVVERRKRGLPGARMVLDCRSALAEAWGLPAATAGLLLLDAEGTVRFFQVGATPDGRVPELLTALDALGLADAAVASGPPR